MARALGASLHLGLQSTGQTGLHQGWGQATSESSSISLPKGQASEGDEIIFMACWHFLALGSLEAAIGLSWMPLESVWNFFALTLAPSGTSWARPILDFLGSLGALLGCP